MKPSLLFVHGAFGRAVHFDAWRDYFAAAGYEARAISLPGHAPPDEGILRHLRLGDCLAAVVDAVAALESPPVVIGHSLGGLLALMAAAETETECAGIVLVGAPAPGLPPARLGAVRYAVPYVTRVLAGLPVSPTPQAVRSLATHDLSPAESDEIVAQTGMESGLVLRKLAFANTVVDYQRIRCPVLCLVGEDDRIVPVHAARRIAAATGAAVIRYPGHGHWLIAGSLTGIVAADVRLWLARNFSR